MKKIAMMVAIGATAAAVPASAAQFVFSFTPNQVLFGTGVSGSGVFTTSDTSTTVGGRQAFAITSITGMVNGSQIVAPTGSGFGAGGAYGNYFTSPPAFLDGSGSRFFTASGIDVRFFFQDGPTSRYRVNTFGTLAGSSFVTAVSSPAVAPVPEPATWAMMLAGFGAIGGAARYRRRGSKVAFA